MMQRTKEGIGKFARGTFNLGVESTAAIGGAWVGDRLLQATHFLDLSSSMTTEFAQMSVIPLFALVKGGIDRKFNPLIVPSLLAFAGAVGAGYLHNQDAMLPAYVGGGLLGGVTEYAISRRGKSKSSGKSA